MAQSKRKKQFMNFSYGIGASIVILGALFKITHISWGPFTGNSMLTLGLVTEAIIFAISAFDDVDEFFDELNEFAAFNDYVRFYYCKDNFVPVARAYDAMLFKYKHSKGQGNVAEIIDKDAASLVAKFQSYLTARGRSALLKNSAIRSAILKIFNWNLKSYNWHMRYKE